MTADPRGREADQLSDEQIFALAGPPSGFNILSFARSVIAADRALRAERGGQPVAWWRWSYVEEDGSRDADVQIGEKRPTCLPDNGFEWQPLYGEPLALGVLAPNPWRAAIDEALVVSCLDCVQPDESPEQALARLVNWEIEMALDPKISKRAADLVSVIAPAATPWGTGLLAREELANGGWVDAGMGAPAATTEPAPYTNAIGEAGQAYHKQFPHAHPLPFLWRWEELWQAMSRAARCNYPNCDGEQPADGGCCALASTAPAAPAAQPARGELIAFLNGSAPLDGVWFGEEKPGARGRFWWRKHLAALASPPIEARAEQATGELEGSWPEIVRFAALVRAEAIEEAARVCEKATERSRWARRIDAGELCPPCAIAAAVRALAKDANHG